MTSNPHIEVIEKAVYAACSDLGDEHIRLRSEFIHLEHILRTLGEKYGMIGSGQFWKYNEHSEQYEMYQDDEFGDHAFDYPIWDFSKDWRNQLPSTLEWITNQFSK